MTQAISLMAIRFRAMKSDRFIWYKPNGHETAPLAGSQGDLNGVGK